MKEAAGAPSGAAVVAMAVVVVLVMVMLLLGMRETLPRSMHHTRMVVTIGDGGDCR